MRLVFILAIAYVLGSIPFGYLIVFATQRADIRETGSGGTGATNVSRRAGKAAGVLTLLLDALKGAAAILVAGTLLGLSPYQANAGWGVAVAGLAAVVGHIFPVWLKFRGGKGVATSVGVFLLLAPLAVALAAVVFVVTVLLTRYVSLGSILATIIIPIGILVDNSFTPDPYVKPLSFAAITCATLILFAHRGNIRRLIQGTESKLK